MRLPLIITVIASSLFISACSTQHQSNDQQRLKLTRIIETQTGQDGRDCIQVSNIRGYAVDGKLINIDAGRKYHVAVTTYRCPDLEMAPKALFGSRYSRACANTSHIMSRQTRCPIHKIYTFENRQAAFDAIKKAKNTQRESDI